MVQAHGRLGEDNGEFEVSLGYILRPWLKKEKKRRKWNGYLTSEATLRCGLQGGTWPSLGTVGYKVMERGPWFVAEHSPESQGQEHFRPERSMGTWTGKSYVGWACGCHSGLNKTDRK